jgi:hypothetical protein
VCVCVCVCGGGGGGAHLCSQRIQPWEGVIMLQYIVQVIFFVVSMIACFEQGIGKIHPRTGHYCLEVEQIYSSALLLTLVLDWGGWPAPRPVVLSNIFLNCFNA